jgi:Omp85 superfamily domain
VKPAIFLLILTRFALAGEAPPTSDHTAAETAGAPVPGDESGRTDEVDSDGVGRVIGRGVLFVPKLVVETIWFPFHGTFWLFDRYHLSHLYYQVFFNENRTIGIVPTLVYQSGFGASAGARFVANNVLGEHERMGIQATTGQITGEPYREGALVDLHSGNRFGKVFELELSGNFDRRPAEPFYGIGNNDETAPPAMPVDPRTDSTSVSVNHRYQEARAAAVGHIHVNRELRISFTGALTELKFAPSATGIPIAEVYDLAELPGFEGGVQHAYGELEVRWDTRRRTIEWEPPRMFSGGSLVVAFAGRVDRLDGGADFWRYGLELQHFFRLARGPRVLITRFRAEGVSGSRAEVPFTELPQLGGGDFLRGYTYERFRDRAAVFGSLQYEWDLSHFTAAFLFTDFGRVFDTLDDLTVRGLRVGYGLGIDIRGESGFLASATIASSIDGGLFFGLSFNPVTDAQQRWR